MTLAAYIRDDLRARLLSAGAPAPLTLRDLSRHYGVSLTPVREAVEDLVRERVLQKDAGGRLSPDPAAPRSARPAPPPPPPRDWHRILSRDVLRRSLRGESGFLREEAAARETGAGRTVLRQVFNRLAGAGLLEHVPRRGWRVRPFREEDLRAYLEVREMMELKALELARDRLDPAELRRILALNRTGPGGAEVDVELHPFLIRASANRFIAEFIERHGAYYTTLFYYATRGARAVSLMARHHVAILRRLLARDWHAAARLLSRHIRAQGPLVRRLMDRLAKLPLDQWPDLGT
jgi:DNA-binding GntR family transcriptional regulator